MYSSFLKKIFNCKCPLILMLILICAARVLGQVGTTDLTNNQNIILSQNQVNYINSNDWDHHYNHYRILQFNLPQSGLTEDVDTITFTYGNEVIEYYLNRYDDYGAEGKVWTGIMNGPGFIELYSSNNSDSLGGYAQFNGHGFRISPLDGNGTTLVFDIDEAVQQQQECGLEDPVSGGGIPPEGPACFMNQCVATLDVLVVITPEAYLEFFGWLQPASPPTIPQVIFNMIRTQLESKIKTAIEWSAIPNTEVNIQFEVLETAFPYSTLVDDLERASEDRNNINNHPELVSKKNQYKSDFVILLTDERYGFVGGIAPFKATANDGGVISTLRGALNSVYFLHEFGHAMGCMHARLGQGGRAKPVGCNHAYVTDNNLGTAVCESVNFLTGFGVVWAPQYANPTSLFFGGAVSLPAGKDDPDGTWNAYVFSNGACEVNQINPSLNLEISCTFPNDYDCNMPESISFEAAATNASGLNLKYHWDIAYSGPVGHFINWSQEDCATLNTWSNDGPAFSLTPDCSQPENRLNVRLRVSTNDPDLCKEYFFKVELLD